MAPEQGPFALDNRWPRIGWWSSAGLLVVAVILGFIVLGREQQNGPSLGTWTAICRALGITADILRSPFDGAFEHHCGAVIQRMRQRRGRMNPFEPVLRKRQAAKKRRPERHRVNARTDVVHKARQRQFGRSRAAA